MSIVGAGCRLPLACMLIVGVAGLRRCWLAVVLLEDVRGAGVSQPRWLHGL